MWTVLRRNADIRRLFTAQLISFIGDWFAYVAFVGLVQDLSSSKLLVSLVISQIAAIWPARRAARIRILDAIHYE